ncbi:MAG: TIGR02679 family protein [Selenomonadaceae bacterium]|jgi:uncharacterized protein (TIGR02679 family)
MMADLYGEARSYFLQKPGLYQLGMAFCEKYRSLDHWGGVVKMEKLSTEEQVDLSSFFRRDVTKKEQVRISYTAFSTAWEKTRFAAMPLEDFLAQLYPGQLLSKRETAAEIEVRRQQLFTELLQQYSCEKATNWLRALQTQKLRLSHFEFYKSKQLLGLVATALSMLPDGYERLPFFANRVSGNPHALDWSTDAGKVFLQALSFLADGAAYNTVEDKNELFYVFHLLRDDILNFATVFGLQALAKETRLLYWQTAAQSLAPLNLPFREIVRADQILPFGEHAGMDFLVYIVENSGVFSMLLDALQQSNKVVPLLCLHGQMKTASWALLDRLAASGAVFLYSGDFDPEGLIIAQKLRQRYERVKLWHFSADEYQKTKNYLTEGRLKRLQGICDIELQPLVKLMQAWKCAFYQESLIDILLEDVMLSY